MNWWKSTVIKLLDKILPARAKQALLHLSFHLAYEEFERYAYEYGFAPNTKLSLAAIARRGFKPGTIIDAGAFVGEWTRMAKHIWPQSTVIMIEPNLLNQAHLTRVAKEFDAQLITELLGADDDRTVDFHVMGSGSSILSERSTVQRTTETRKLRRLDSLLSSPAGPILLKIDAQGYELEILKGATKLLPAIEAVLLEIAIIEINQGAPLLHDTLTFMKSLGFVTYDILQIHRRPLDRALNQIDIIFIREQSFLIADKRHFA